MILVIKYIRLFAYVCLLCVQPLCSAVEESPVTLELVAEDNTVNPGTPFWVALQLHISDGWHAYWKNPGELGMPIKVDWALPPEYQVSSLEWPTPTRFESAGIEGFGYEGDVVFLARITPDPKMKTPQKAAISANVSWLVCSSTTCLPGKGNASLSVNTAKQIPTSNPQWTQLFADARHHLPEKHAPLRVIRQKDGTLLISLPAGRLLKENEWTVDFYPAVQKHLDPTSKPQILSSGLISLKEKSGDKPVLQGVLLIKGQEQLSYDVDHPIEEGVTLAPITATKFEGGLALALVFAFVGGMILNLMPCVLPIISLKIMSFVKIAGQSRSLVFKHGLSFSLGVILSFWCLAGMMLLLQAYGQSVGWGFQLQEPIFVALLGALMLIIGLNMFGLFEVGLGVASLAGQAQSEAAQKKDGLLNSFLSGVLATAVATPCTGPFLGSAVGFAFTLPAALALLVFTFLGLGMAFPYLILSAFPSFLRFMPKPGAWMITFKEIVGFVMMATVLWLVWIFGAQKGNMAVTMLLFSFLFIAIACWIYGKWNQPSKRRLSRVLAYVSASLFIALSGFILFTASSSPEDEPLAVNTHAKAIHDWETFSPERVAELQKQGIPVFVDFTAKWCLICQANHLILSQDDVRNKMAESGVVKMKADWTKNDEVITAELRKFGRNSVPLYVLYGTDPNEPPRILPQVLSSDIVSQHLDAIADNSP